VRTNFFDRPSDGQFDPAADGQGGEHDREVGFDRVAFVVVDLPGLHVVLGHPERLPGLEQPVVGAGHELGGDGLPLGQAARLVTHPFRPARAQRWPPVPG
jgi:hypothetical protein